MPMKPIAVSRRKNYGGTTLVNTKYSPMETITLAKDADTTSCSAVLEYRRNLLTTAGLLPKPLQLTLPDWDAAAAKEVGRKPPLVVISTNRAKWIKDGMAAADLQPPSEKPFDNASDLRALAAKAGQTISAPIYSPSRIGDAGERGIYIVVHASEYTKYKKTVVHDDITIVGWEFETPRTLTRTDKRTQRDMHKMWLTGFGASRFAALSFCKQLRTAALAAAEESEKEDTTVWNYAWLFDDNVVALDGFAGYQAVETEMASLEAMGSTQACAGFHGGTVAETQAEITAWATRELAARRGKQAAKLPKPSRPGLLQQAVLWNIDYLAEQKLNVGLVYVNSAEDVSLVNYFDANDTPYLYYKSIPIKKELPKNDSGALKVKYSRDLLTAWLTHMEGLAPAEAVKPPPPPPPIVVQAETADGGEQTLANFVVNHVLPKSSDLKSQAGKIDLQNNAKCQAVEQLTAQAVKDDCVNEATLKLIFSDADQVVEQISEAGA